MLGLSREACTPVLVIADSAPTMASPTQPVSVSGSSVLNWNEPPDQSQSGVCHSMVAAEMLSQALGVNVSAASIAYTYKDERNFLVKLGEFANPEAARPDYFTGTIGGALTSALRHGICREENFPLWQLWGRLRDPDSSTSSSTSVQSQAPERRLELGEICQQTPERPRGLMWTLISTEAPHAMTGQPTPRLDGIDEVLNSGRIVGLDHNVWPILNSQQQSKTPRLLGVLPVAGHSASLVGRRWHNGRCQYLYRNSWGRSCHQYREDLSCDRGHVWLDEAEVLRITMYAYALIPAQP